MTFQKEDFVVYPRYGVGRVLGVAKKKFAGQSENCLGIQFEHQNLSLFIPLHRVEKVKLRKVMSKSTATRVLTTMKLRARFKPSQTHKERLKDYQGKFNSGDPLEMAEVARDLARLSKRQDLSMEEEGLCRESITLLAREIAVSKNKETIAIRHNIEKLLYR